jgi:hypothetical protein
VTSELHVTEADWRALLVEELELIEPSTFEAACAASRRFRTPLDRVLAERARLPYAFLLERLADAWGVGFTGLRVTDVSPEALKLVREEFARANGAVAFHRDDGVLDVALADPRQRKVIADIERVTRLTVRPTWRRCAPSAVPTCCTAATFATSCDRPVRCRWLPRRAATRRRRPRC